MYLLETNRIYFARHEFAHVVERMAETHVIDFEPTKLLAHARRNVQAIRCSARYTWLLPLEKSVNITKQLGRVQGAETRTKIKPFSGQIYWIIIL